MAPETFDIWTDAVAGLGDAEAANLAVVSLYKTQAHRPKIAEFMDSYAAEMRQIRMEALTAMTRSLPAGDHPGFFSIEAQRRHEAVHRIGGTSDHPLTIPDEEIDRAEEAARQAWMSRGATSRERVASVLADMAKLEESAEV